jgi:uncharacterized DUF497 family protein
LAHDVRVKFVWDSRKETENIAAHGVDFENAKLAFLDPGRILMCDKRHSQNESRFFCIGLVKGRALSVRFVLRRGDIRIIGAGFWRQGKKIYEKKNR